MIFRQRETRLAKLATAPKRHDLDFIVDNELGKALAIIRKAVRLRQDHGPNDAKSFAPPPDRKFARLTEELDQLSIDLELLIPDLRARR